jgi:hypothetical protein
VLTQHVCPHLRRTEGYINKWALYVILNIDHRPWNSTGPDPGSVPWLLAAALAETNPDGSDVYLALHDDRTQTEDTDTFSGTAPKTLADSCTNMDDIELPEDK